ncbi:hypothetical protein MAFF211479_48840 (plasmid) [Ralstonia solanacearum]|nr:hypothetical protein 24 [Ralstonia solanacearum]BCI56335.1 hypothetical protein 24 [Ralstonia solanacearum]BCI56369.1 hypothetical protein 20 [Ralstonia solanacearum]BCL95182.1 hypothetical protein MAFF211479_48840 [Ralstonia solanacearum]BCM00289.1 hypothetical protein MAFF211491_47420 [Ralstonia solanacearum]
MRLAQLLLPAMHKKGAGTIMNITSMGGKIYTLLGAWSDWLRLELASFGINVVVVVEPGLMRPGSAMWFPTACSNDRAKAHAQS